MKKNTGQKKFSMLDWMLSIDFDPVEIIYCCRLRVAPTVAHGISTRFSAGPQAINVLLRAISEKPFPN